MGYGQYAIETYLRQAPMLHVYELGDLDPAMQRHVRWFSRGRDGLPDAVALRFDGLSTPTLIALAHDDLDALRVLVKTIDMPRRYYAHVTPGLQNVLAGVHKPLGRHLKMGLPRGTPLGPLEAVIRFGAADADELVAFYRDAYPGNHFEKSSLGVGPYVGLRARRGIIAAAGVHVYSELQRVAALGNIATHPEHRGNGLATIVTRGLVQLLAPHADVIGLNVRRQRRGDRVLRAHRLSRDRRLRRAARRALKTRTPRGAGRRDAWDVKLSGRAAPRTGRRRGTGPRSRGS